MLAEFAVIDEQNVAGKDTETTGYDFENQTFETSSRDTNTHQSRVKVSKPDEFGITANTTYDYSPYENDGSWAKLGETEKPAELEIMGEKTAGAQLQYSGFFKTDADGNYDSKSSDGYDETNNYHRDDYTNILFLDGHVEAGSMNAFQSKANLRYQYNVANDEDHPFNWKVGDTKTGGAWNPDQ